MPSAFSAVDKVLSAGLYAITCLQLWAAVETRKLYVRNRLGFTSEEIEFFIRPLEADEFEYSSDIRRILSPASRSGEPPFENINARVGAVKNLLDNFALTKNRPKELTLVNLKDTLHLQDLWSAAADFTGSLKLASKHHDLNAITKIAADPRHAKTIAFLRIVGTAFVTTKNKAELGKGRVFAGSSLGVDEKYGPVSVIYIDPKKQAVYVELQALGPRIFTASQGYVDKKYYGARIYEIALAAAGVVALTELLFLAMGFMPALIEGGFVALIYEIGVYFITDKIAEKAAEIDPVFGAILGFVLQAGAPRPKFHPQLKGADELIAADERPDPSGLAGVLNRSTESPPANRMVGLENRELPPPRPFRRRLKHGRPSPTNPPSRLRAAPRRRRRSKKNPTSPRLHGRKPRQPGRRRYPSVRLRTTTSPRSTPSNRPSATFGRSRRPNRPPPNRGRSSWPRRVVDGGAGLRTAAT